MVIPLVLPRLVIGIEAGADLAGSVAALNRMLGLPGGLAAPGVPEEVLPGIAAHAERDPATATNPRAATGEDYLELLRSSW